MLQNLPKMKEIGKEVCAREGCELYDLEYSPGSKGKGRKLIVFVEKQGGVSLEDCERVSKGLSTILDEQELIPDGDYALEVSSPGLERPLREKWHFDAVIGQNIYVQSTDSMIPDNPENKKRFKVTGLLKSVADKEIKVTCDGQDFDIRINNIKRANVVFDYNSLKNQKKN